MLKIIKYLSYNKNKSNKNYIKCTKFKVSINFITNSYLLGIQKVQKLKMMKTEDRDRDHMILLKKVAWISLILLQNAWLHLEVLF